MIGPQYVCDHGIPCSAELVGLNTALMRGSQVDLLSDGFCVFAVIITISCSAQIVGNGK